jgi:predicted transposase YbfD/YdcC
VPDLRKSRGKRHPLVAILALAMAAVLCGYDSLTAISQWDREHGPALLAPLGFRHFPGPCVATLHRVFRQLDVMALEHVLREWLLTCLPAQGGLALDGKTLRGSRDGSDDPVQLLAVFAQTVGVALGQQPITGKNEVAAALEFLQSLDLTGWIVTGDAGFTHKTVAETILQQGSDYVLTVKKNQPTLYADIELLFAESAVVSDTLTSCRQLNMHGSRGEERILQASIALQGLLSVARSAPSLSHRTPFH